MKPKIMNTPYIKIVKVNLIDEGRSISVSSRGHNQYRK